MTWLIVVLAAVVLAAAIGYRWWQMRALQQRFGPEYERLVEQEGDPRRARAALRDRMKRRAGLEVRPLSPDAHERYATQWPTVQARFVDDPRGALDEAAGVVAALLRDRGYAPADRPAYDPVDLDLVATDHASAVNDYRGAQTIHGNAGASTEDLRKALLFYRALFEELLVMEPASDDAALVDHQL
jgi:hypothetical protein